MGTLELQNQEAIVAKNEVISNSEILKTDPKEIVATLKTKETEIKSFYQSAEMLAANKKLYEEKVGNKSYEEINKLSNPAKKEAEEAIKSYATSLNISTTDISKADKGTKLYEANKDNNTNLIPVPSIDEDKYTFTIVNVIAGQQTCSLKTTESGYILDGNTNFTMFDEKTKVYKHLSASVDATTGKIDMTEKKAGKTTLDATKTLDLKTTKDGYEYNYKITAPGGKEAILSITFDKDGKVNDQFYYKQDGKNIVKYHISAGTMPWTVITDAVSDKLTRKESKQTVKTKMESDLQPTTTETATNIVKSNNEIRYLEDTNSIAILNTNNTTKRVIPSSTTKNHFVEGGVIYDHIGNTFTKSSNNYKTQQEQLLTKTETGTNGEQKNSIKSQLMKQGIEASILCTAKKDCQDIVSDASQLYDRTLTLKKDGVDYTLDMSLAKETGGYTMKIGDQYLTVKEAGTTFAIEASKDYNLDKYLNQPGNPFTSSQDLKKTGATVKLGTFDTQSGKQQFSIGEEKYMVDKDGKLYDKEGKGKDKITVLGEDKITYHDLTLNPTDFSWKAEKNTVEAAKVKAAESKETEQKAIDTKINTLLNGSGYSINIARTIQDDKLMLTKTTSTPGNEKTSILINKNGTIPANTKVQKRDATTSSYRETADFAMIGFDGKLKIANQTDYNTETAKLKTMNEHKSLADGFIASGWDKAIITNLDGSITMKLYSPENIKTHLSTEVFKDNPLKDHNTKLEAYNTAKSNLATFSDKTKKDYKDFKTKFIQDNGARDDTTGNTERDKKVDSKRKELISEQISETDAKAYQEEINKAIQAYTGEKLPTIPTATLTIPLTGAIADNNGFSATINSGKLIIKQGTTELGSSTINSTPTNIASTAPAPQGIAQRQQQILNDASPDARSITIGDGAAAITYERKDGGWKQQETTPAIAKTVEKSPNSLTQEFVNKLPGSADKTQLFTALSAIDGITTDMNAVKIWEKATGFTATRENRGGQFGPNTLKRIQDRASKGKPTSTTNRGYT